MTLPVKTTVSYQAADGDYEAPREQRADLELYKTTQAPGAGAHFLPISPSLEKNMPVYSLTGIISYCSLLKAPHEFILMIKED